MRFCFCLFNYFPFGGLERDFMDISQACQVAGHTIEVFTGDWQGDVPPNMRVTILPVQGFSNHARSRSFHQLFMEAIKGQEYDLVVGFNKIPDLDVYYGADVCYLARMRRSRSFLSILTPRYHLLSRFERAVFSPESSTQIIHLAEPEKRNYQDCYDTPDERFHYAPPGVDVPRIRAHLTLKIRAKMRAELGLQAGDIGLLMVGSNYYTKGVDRAIHAMGSLAKAVQQRVQLYVVGKGKASPLTRLARQYGVAEQVHFMGGRDDVPRFLVACDFLLQPSVNENTGNAIVEAIVAGMPVLATETCGYSEHVLKGDCGLVVMGAFSQDNMNVLLGELLTSTRKREWQENCLHYAEAHDLGHRPQIVTQLLTDMATLKQAGS
ncbi:MAG: glycosyltransferase family 4 protein [Desulfobulbaceae bacterium]|jgi:UDP-glucose:(heptosyl)LPS alpha-1,3-glucosyltransferase|nr:glycosyltransferase family 4 protein [Desulfobulbaceae bacterium]